MITRSQAFKAIAKRLKRWDDLKKISSFSIEGFYKNHSLANPKKVHKNIH